MNIDESLYTVLYAVCGGLTGWYLGRKGIGYLAFFIFALITIKALFFGLGK